MNRSLSILLATLVVLLCVGALILRMRSNSPEATNTLVQAIKKDDIAQVKSMLNSGFNVNSKDTQGAPLLMLAISGRKTDVARLFIEHGADINVVDEEGNSPLVIAARQGQLEIVNLLLERGAQVDHANNEGYTPLLAAATTKNIEIFRALLNKGANVNAQTIHGTTLLMFAAGGATLSASRPMQAGGGTATGVTPPTESSTTSVVPVGEDAKIVEFLLNNRAEPNMGDSSGTTAMMFAAMHGQNSVIEVLLAHGAKIDVANKRSGWTALMQAAFSNQVSTITLLIKHKADPNIKDLKGMTALQIAQKFQKSEAIECLQKAEGKK